MVIVAFPCASGYPDRVQVGQDHRTGLKEGERPEKEQANNKRRKPSRPSEASDQAQGSWEHREGAPKASDGPQSPSEGLLTLCHQARSGDATQRVCRQPVRPLCRHAVTWPPLGGGPKAKW
jgi:hypothetical protein